MKRLTKVEKVLIASVDTSRHTTFRCDEHGVFQLLNEVATGECPCCKKKHDPMIDIEQLKETYMRELGWEELPQGEK